MTAPEGPLAGERIVLAGASSGIGRALALDLVGAGAQVVLAARREEELDKIIATAGGGFAVPTDITSAIDCGLLAEQAAERLGAIDIVVSCVGTAPLKLLADTSAADWREVFETNVIGFHHLVQAFLPVLEPGALVMALSSESVDQERSALGAYAASKVALERTIAAWRTEHPGIRFSRVRVGATAPTGFGERFDPDTLHHALTDWAAHGLAQMDFMSPEEVAGTLAGLLGVAAAHPGVRMDELTLRSPSSVVTSFDQALAGRETRSQGA